MGVVLRNMTIYLDIVLLENVVMNYIILFATGLINKTNIKQFRIIISSLIGALYAVMSFITNLNIYNTLILKIILSIAMIYIAFTPKNIKKLFKELLLFYLISFAFGGCAFFLLYYIKPQEILSKNGILIGSYPLKIAVLGGILGFIIVNITFKLIKDKIDKSNLICNVKICFEESFIEIKALMDTGNLLKDPISGYSVIVVEVNKLKEIVPEVVIENIDKIIKGDEENILNSIEDKYKLRFRVIPFSSLGKENGMLLGFRPDYIIAHYEEEEIKIEHIIVGLYNKHITKNESYCALMGLDVIKNINGKQGELDEYNANIKI